MAFPTILIDVAFGNAPFDTSPTFTDISAYVREWSTSRGRSSQLDGFSAGTASIVLDNRDRRFDPLYASSPYNPNVKPNKRVRIRATANAVTYPIFDGYVDDWRQEYTLGGDQVCVLGATDGFKLLTRKTLTGQVLNLTFASVLVGVILNTVGWPAARRNISGLATITRGLTADEVAGRGALDLLQDIAKTEQGLMFIERDGDFAFRGRSDLQTVASFTTSQVTFGDVVPPSSGEVPYTGLGFDHSETLVRNWIDVRNPAFTVDGQTESFSDATSIAAYGTLSFGLETLDATAAAARNTGANLLALYKDPQVRVQELRLALIREDATFPNGLYASVLNRELGDRVTVKRRPTGGGTITQDNWIDRIAHRVTAHKTWETALGLGIAQTAQGYGVWDTSVWGTGKWAW